MGKGKKPIRTPAAEQGKRIKGPEVVPEGSTDHLTPHFCLTHLGGSHPLSACNDEEKAAFADRMHELSQLTWQQIKAAPRHGQGHEKIPREKLRGVSIPLEATEDIPILSLRFCGKKPMLGYRIGRVLTILALDRDFTAYDHGG